MLVGLLAEREVTSVKQLSKLTADTLNLPEGTSAGKVSFLADACEEARALRQSEAGTGECVCVSQLRG